MPYQAGKRLPGEHANYSGHLDVIKSESVRKLVESFKTSGSALVNKSVWSPIPISDEPLHRIFCADGSMVPIISDEEPFREIAFVKTALLGLDQYAISKLDKHSPHPLAVRDILADSAVKHSTAFPLKNVSMAGMNTFETIRHVLFDSINDPSFDGHILDTLKWLVYRKWDGVPKPLPYFGCPHCWETSERNLATLSYDSITGNCPSCGGDLLLTDYLGFHQSMSPDSAPEQVPTDYMLIHETLLLLTGIRYFWEKRKEMLHDSLFIKDGPLSIRAQYSKLVEPIREFFEFAAKQGFPVYMVGQEKSGNFYDHLAFIGRRAPEGQMFIPSNRYIKEQIQGRPNTGDPYGKYTNYGAKIFVKLSQYTNMVLNIPFGRFKPDPLLSDLIGAPRIFATIPGILSYQYEGALLPIQLANGVASLSTYPSAHILGIFAQKSWL